MSGIKWVFSMMHHCVNIDLCALSGGVVSYLRIDWPAAAPACWEQHHRLQLKPFPRKQESRPQLGRNNDIFAAEGNAKSSVCVTFSKIHWISNRAFYSASHLLFCLAGVDSCRSFPRLIVKQWQWNIQRDQLSPTCECVVMRKQQLIFDFNIHLMDGWNNPKCFNQTPNVSNDSWNERKIKTQLLNYS